MNTPTDAGTSGRTRYNIRVLDRAIRVLSILADGKPRTLAELSADIDLSPSTTFRLLATLLYYRYVQRDEHTGQYSLGLASLELSRAFYDSNDLRRTALADLEALRDDVKETVHLALLDQMEIVYLEKLPGLHAIGLMGSRIGGRAPAYCTGVGKVLLAYQNPATVAEFFTQNPMRRFTDATLTTVEELTRELEAVRQRGYALDRGEHEAEVRCVAAPIFNMSGEIVAALSISGPAGRMEPLETNHELIAKTCRTAQTISEKLGFHPRSATGVTASVGSNHNPSER